MRGRTCEAEPDMRKCCQCTYGAAGTDGTRTRERASLVRVHSCCERTLITTTVYFQETAAVCEQLHLSLGPSEQDTALHSGISGALPRAIQCLIDSCSPEQLQRSLGRANKRPQRQWKGRGGLLRAIYTCGRQKKACPDLCTDCRRLSSACPAHRTTMPSQTL